MVVDFAKALEGKDEIKIGFAKKDGRRRKIPVWFNVEGQTLELLPMYGLKTKWFGDVERAKKLDLEVEGAKIAVTPTILKDSKQVDTIKGHFAAKYGDGEVKRYYPTSEVALKIRI